MRAAVIRQFGEPKDVRVEEVPTPGPKDGEVLIEVRAASIKPFKVQPGQPRPLAEAAAAYAQATHGGAKVLLRPNDGKE